MRPFYQSISDLNLKGLDVMMLQLKPVINRYTERNIKFRSQFILSIKSFLELLTQFALGMNLNIKLMLKVGLKLTFTISLLIKHIYLIGFSKFHKFRSNLVSTSGQ
jgi:hypothetical protein